MKTSVFLVVALSIALLAALSVFSLAQEGPGMMCMTQKGISVNGTAEVRVAPDIAYAVIGVQTQAKNAKEASQANAATMQQVLKAIKGLKIADADIKTTQFTLQPTYSYPQNAPRKLIGYEATNLVRVTIRNLSQVGPIIDAATEAGANVEQNVSFALADESAARNQALADAVADGKEKALTIAKALNVGLGSIVNVQESGGPSFVPVYARAEMLGAGSPTPISPGEITVRANVSLTFAIGE